ncbi:M17 family metallopeptidase [Brevibacterium casei]|uniref:M17 family metallopeptidase n=1 Tax=Brevibacterium casei TaxID=33889 RepID=UPI003702D669
MPFTHVRNHSGHPAAVITAGTVSGEPMVAGEPPTMVRLPAFPVEGRPTLALDWGRDLGRFILAGGDWSTAQGTSGECLVDLTRLDLRPALLRPVLAGIIDGIGGLGPLESTTIVLDFPDDPAEVDRALEVELALRRGTEIARELTDARANQLGPMDFARRAEQLAAEHGLGFRMRGSSELADGGFGGITAIGQGSRRPPALVELWLFSNAGNEAAPASASAGPPTEALAFAGKGITFDTGGLSLKSPEAMYSMHTDCAGAAAVLGAMVALALTGCEQPVHAVLPLAENVPGPDSVFPGDVVTIRDGTGLEIVDTDFEGRVVLADALSLIGEHRPRAVVSLATLTYQAMVALGGEIAAVLARDEVLSNQVLDAAETAGEEAWPLPWARRYAAQIRSTAPGATLRNHPRTDTGRAITAALLLGEFVDPAVPFAHIDFGGPALRHEAGGVHATGWGVRTMHELATNFTYERIRRDR